MSYRTDHDLTGIIDNLFVYPIKSCAGIAVQEATLTETGLEWDREWMVVDPSGEFITQRSFPRMALIQPQLRSSEMVLRAPGMLALHLRLDAVEDATKVRVWDDEVPAWSMGAIAAQWFSDFLGTPARLVRFDPEYRRICDERWTNGVEAITQFSDGFPMLVTSSASIDELNQRLTSAGHSAVDARRFRPNIVIGGVESHDEDRIDELFIEANESEVELRMVKPCTRCPIPDIDPETAEPGTKVGDAIRTYRQDPRMKGAITFGMNAIAVSGEGRVLRVGQRVAANLRFE